MLLPGFLLQNGLMENRRLIFFTDGAKCIKDAIEKYFKFREYTIILDWLHLRKKLKEMLSMAVKGSKEEKRAIAKGLLRILWAGNAEKAKDYLKNLKKKNVKNEIMLSEACAYITRKQPYIICYAFRAMAHLKNSSNRVEKENDLLVAQRQKHNGMSWSSGGSGALAAIRMAETNGELENWLVNREISFRVAA